MSGALDRIDELLLEALQNDARTPNKTLAARAGIAPSTCLERVRRLEARGVLRGYRAEVDPAAVGRGLEALVSVRLIRHAREVVESFRGHALSLPEVLAVYHLGGTDDFLLHVAVADADHLRDFVMDALTERPEVARFETSLVFEHVRRPALAPVSAGGRARAT
jgi:DNA-binding Lrp family transcriptional regulator